MGYKNNTQLLREQLGKEGNITTIPAGTVIFANITAITLTSGVAIGYHN